MFFVLQFLLLSFASHFFLLLLLPFFPLNFAHSSNSTVAQASIANLCLTINTFSHVCFCSTSPCLSAFPHSSFLTLTPVHCLFVRTRTNVTRFYRWTRQFFEFLLFSRWPAVIMSLLLLLLLLPVLVPLLTYFITAFFIGVQAFKRVHAIIVLSE